MTNISVSLSLCYAGHHWKNRLFPIQCLFWLTYGGATGIVVSESFVGMPYGRTQEFASAHQLTDVRNLKE